MSELKSEKPVWRGNQQVCRRSRKFTEAVKGLMAKFQNQVEPIGDGEFHPSSVVLVTKRTKAFWVTGAGAKPQLALLDLTKTQAGGMDNSYYQFRTWIAPEMQAMAIDKTKAVNSVGFGANADVETVDKSKVTGL